MKGKFGEFGKIRGGFRGEKKGILRVKNGNFGGGKK